MKPIITFILFGAAMTAIGCETGGCYYTCCTAAETCTASCGENYESAEECTVTAQKKCSETGGFIARAEWTEVSEVFCDSCSASACAPNWWTADNTAQDTTRSTDPISSEMDKTATSDTSSASANMPKAVTLDSDTDTLIPPSEFESSETEE